LLSCTRFYYAFTRFRPERLHFFFKDSAEFLSLELGPGYIFEKLDGVKENYLAPKIKQELQLEISKTAKLFEKMSYSANAEKFKDYLWETSIGLESKVTEMLSLVFSVENKNVGQPASGKKHNDLAIITAFKFDL